MWKHVSYSPAILGVIKLRCQFFFFGSILLPSRLSHKSLQNLFLCETPNASPGTWCELEVTRSPERSFAPPTLSQPGNYADISLTKKAPLVCEVITRPHFLTWQSVTRMHIFLISVTVIYFSWIKYKWDWSVFHLSWYILTFLSFSIEWLRIIIS